MKYFHKKKQEKGTSFIKSMPESAQNDTYNFCKNGKKCTKNLSFLRKPRVFKALAASGLALFMGIGTLCGVLLIPINAAQASITNNKDASISSTASSLGLDPKNDPIVFTTESGLEIKYAKDLTNTNLAGYTYFTMGIYGTTPLNWVIIGYDSSLSKFVGQNTGETSLKPYSYVIQGEYAIRDTCDNSSAGVAIINDYCAISSLAVENDEIGDSCVLCLSEISLFTARVNASSVSNMAAYNSSELKKQVDKLYTSTLNFSASDKAIIVPQDFTSLYQYNDRTQISNSENCYLFPLAARGEKFNCTTYLTNATVRSGANTWWLRSGRADSSESFQVYTVSNTGGISQYLWAYEYYYIRPAMVVKII